VIVAWFVIVIKTSEDFPAVYGFLFIWIFWVLHSTVMKIVFLLNDGNDDNNDGEIDIHKSIISHGLTGAGAIIYSYIFFGVFTLLYLKPLDFFERYRIHALAISLTVISFVPVQDANMMTTPPEYTLARGTISLILYMCMVIRFIHVGSDCGKKCGVNVIMTVMFVYFASIYAIVGIFIPVIAYYIYLCVVDIRGGDFHLGE
jgi:hypothetical protein